MRTVVFGCLYTYLLWPEDFSPNISAHMSSRRLFIWVEKGLYSTVPVSGLRSWSPVSLIAGNSYGNSLTTWQLAGRGCRGLVPWPGLPGNLGFVADPWIFFGGGKMLYNKKMSTWQKLGTCVSVSVSHCVCDMLMLILGTCWNFFVLMCKVQSEHL